MSKTPFSKFHQKSRKERLALLAQSGLLDEQDLQTLARATHPDIIDQAEHFVENVIGCFPLPMGVLPQCIIDGIPRTIPLAVEETSIIAGLNKTAKWVQSLGTITTKRSGDCIIGQIQLHHVPDTEVFLRQVEANANHWIAAVNQHVLSSLVKRGGGLVRIDTRFIPGEGHTMAVLHLYANTLDAMGANLINQACEYLKPHIEQITGVAVDLCIVSNLVDSMLTSCTIELEGVDEQEGMAIAKASTFAALDPYRACTHNKGVLNGIDAVLIATGNDWRAVEAGIHAYACRDGQYRGISTWAYDNGTLKGHLEAPIIVGTVGGVTTLHPIAKLNMKMLGTNSAQMLSRICAAVGLLQNLAALRALGTQGIVSGHMKLHIDNLVLSSGAKAHEIAPLRAKLESRLSAKRKITQSDATELLVKWRLEHSETL